MKHEIIYTQDFALIVSDEEITKGDFCYDLDASPGYKNHKSIVRCLRTAKDSYWNKNCKKIIAHRPFTDAAILEGVPLLPEFNEDDVLNNLVGGYIKKEVEPTVSKNSSQDYRIGAYGGSDIGFRKGYNKAKETYKYTEKDLRKAFTKYAFSSTINQPYNEEELEESFNEFIQFLQPKRPQYFKCETITMNKGYTDKSDYPYQECEILKTIINSQNQTELVGEYIYE